ncbi:DDE-type integrase/transposase/recombinase [Sphingomonas sp. SRS2]|uniref:DDE-type integrase/transposase/recombinase n=1 Tax=Sphingomonas sp. SRS2 TaxID=133190 RepID=UPI0006989090|nr:DDE-type integrase/transposase/recombinase [Sphingomonas sp. SRS2]
MTAKLYSASEIAAFELPDFSATKRGILAYLTKNEVEPFATGGRGNAGLYRVEDLPERLRSALEQRTAPRLAVRAPKPVNDISRSVGRPKGSDYWTQNPEVADAVVSILARQKISAARIRELLETRYIELPSDRSLQRFIKHYETTRPALLASTRDPDLFKGKYRLALGRADAGTTRAHEVWELDTTKADVLTKGGRIMILGLIDRFSRRARFIIAPSESGQSVRRLLIDTIQAWGVMPEAVATDNGSGYINKSIVSALEALGIEHKLCPPGSPEKKPFVERLFGTFTRERAELLGGYAGHNVADAQRLRGRAKKETGRAVIIPEMEPEELQAVLDAWVDGVYHQRRHGSLGMSPMAKWQSCTAAPAAAPSRDVLLMALSALVGSVTVGKRGVQWKKGRYWAPELAAFVGRPVLVRRDEDELGELFIFGEDGRFICTATNSERAGISEEAFAVEARRQQAAYMKAARADIRQKQNNFRFEDARDALLRRDAESAGKLAILPRATVERSTPVLDSLAEPTPLPQPIDPDVVATRVARADHLISQADDGHEVPADQLAWAQAFASGPAYAGFKARQESGFATGKIINFSLPHRR